MKIHVVNSGETLWKISRQYGVPINEIVTANQLPNPNQLVVGQALVIPEVGLQHVVTPGENLWIIARRYGTSIQAILKENAISNPELIYPGQVLIIPTRYHVVSRGETLWSIAQRYGTTIQAIREINQIRNESLIYPGQRLMIPKKEKPAIEVNAYLNLIESGEFMPVEEEQSIVSQIGELLTYLSVFSYDIKEDGNITSLTDQKLLEAAHSHEIEPLMVITNFKDGKFSSELVHQLLNNASAQDKLLTNILNIMDQKKYAGLNIDFEYVNPSDREAYNEFLRKAVNRLHPKGYSVSTAVAPKYSSEQKGLLYEAHDYEAHGEIVDFVVVMTYEWGWAGGPPWAIAPVNEVRRVLEYAIQAIPPNKILMGMPLYGRDWKLPYVAGGPFAEQLSPQEALSRAFKFGVSIQYHPIYEAPFYNYVDGQGIKHEVWFEDARSVQAKFNLVKTYKLRGVSYWVLGQSFPQNWLLLKDNFQIIKK
ncbi:MAG: LysM peptidoglycan-binding domain-containing protein [Bacillota bacterium]